MCSRTSEQITRSNVASGNGRCSASPCTADGVQGRGVEFTGGDHRGEHVLHALDLVATGVERDHVGAATRRLEGVAPEPAAEVEHRVAAFQAEPVVARGEHQSKSIDVRQRLPGEDRVVTGGRAARGHLPGEALHHALATRGAEALAQRRVVEQPPIAATSASGLLGSTSSPVSSLTPTTSGSAPPVVATTGTPQLIASIAGSENPS